MRKDEKLKTIYETIAPHITRTESAWRDYLGFAARLYKYSFDNSLLVYAQNPNVTILATTPIWNKLGRYINKGANGLAVCEYDNAKLTIKHLFDISQTNGREIVTTNWQLDDKMKTELTSRLSYSHNLAVSSFKDCLVQLVEEVVSERLDDYLQDFDFDIEGHMFSRVPQDGLHSQMHEIVKDSVIYFIGKRCSLSGDEIHTGNGMRTIAHFDSIPLIARVGHTVTDLSKGILLEIERTIKIIEQERKMTYEQNRNELHREGRGTSPEPSNLQQQRGRQQATGSLRQNGDGVPARKPSPAVYDFENGWHINGENAPDSQGSSGENRRDHTANAGERTNAGDRGYHGENPPLEQPEIFSGGNRSERDSFQGKIRPPGIQNEEPSESEQESPPDGSFFAQKILKQGDEESLEDRIGNFNIPDEIEEMNINRGKGFTLTGKKGKKEDELYACVDSYLCNTQIIYKGWHNEIAEALAKQSEIDEYLMADYFRDLDERETRIDGQTITCFVGDQGVEFQIDQYDVSLKWTELSKRIKNLIETGNFPVQQAITSTEKKQSSNIKVLVVEPEKKPYLADIPSDYKAFQEKVGGLITTLEIEDGIDAVCADDVDFNTTPINRMIHGQPILGTFVVARVEYNTGKYESLNEIDIQKYMDKFAAPLIDISRLVSEYEEIDALQEDVELDEEGMDDNPSNYLEAENNPKIPSSQQMSLFDMANAPKDKEAELIEYVLLEGSQVAGGKQRIYEFAMTNPTGSAFERMLKDEYGIGGHTINKHGIHFENHDSKGIVFDWVDDEGEKHETRITWLRAAVVIQHLIDQGRYLENHGHNTAYENDKRNEHEEGISNPSTQHQIEIKNIQPVRNNFRYSDSYNLYPGGEKTKYKNNVEAIKLLKKIEGEKRLASPEEQIVLARYVGWGGLANAFSDTASSWEKEYHELKHLLDEREYSDALNSVITAYYTEPELIHKIYKAIETFGFTGGSDRKILDPAMGTGNYFSVLPKSYEETPLYGVELDSITGRIAKQLYQKADIQVQGFETTRFEDNSFDIAIGNIPFNSIRLYDKRYDKEDFHIHDYFFAKSLDLIKPGGIITFITSKGTMDKKDTNVREYIARRADLIGAIRLPNTAFKGLAGTEVTADILFLQKLEQQRTCDKYSLPDWVFTNVRKSDYMNMNQYFIDHPEMVLGEMQYSKRMYGQEDGTACVAPKEQDLYMELDRAVGTLKATFTAKADQPILEEPEEEEANSGELEAPEGTKNYTYFVQDDRIYYCERNKLIPQDYTGIRAERIKGLCGIRSALLKVIQIQTSEYLSYDLQQAQKTLNEVYDRFVKKYGAINDKANILIFSDDDQFPLLRSIEDQSEDKKSWNKAPIFHKATIRSYRRPTHAETAKEALEISLNLKMKIDLPYMEKLTGKTSEEIIEELGERLYLNPQKYYGNYREGWELNEEYLSGQVRDKLLYARQKAEEYPELFERNVKALEAVQPKWLEPSEIDFRIGSPWIPIEYFQKFMHETFGTTAYLRDKITVDYMEYTTTWRVNGKTSEPTSVKVNNTFGTKRVNAYQIFEDCLNLQSTTVRDPVPYVDKNGKDQVRYVVNANETMIARAKQNQIKEAFASWLFNDKERADVLLKIYNEKFNTIRPRVYDGSHLVFPGMSEEVELRPHQKNFAARVIYSGTGLAGHVVGAVLCR